MTHAVHDDACILPSRTQLAYYQHSSCVCTNSRQVLSGLSRPWNVEVDNCCEGKPRSCLRLQNCSKMSKTSWRGLTSSSPPPSSRVPDAIIKSRRGNFATATFPRCKVGWDELKRSNERQKINPDKNLQSWGNSDFILLSFTFCSVLYLFVARLIVLNVLRWHCSSRCFCFCRRKRNWLRHQLFHTQALKPEYLVFSNLICLYQIGLQKNFHLLVHLLLSLFNTRPWQTFLYLENALVLL